MKPEKIYLQYLRTIERIAAFVARRNHMNPDETAEFTQEVCVRLLEDDYGIIRKFEGRSRFTTYLTTVITRLHHQYRIELWGKWRPSAEAKRLGGKAITLERLLTRDGYSFAEAVKTLTTPAGSPYTPAELEGIYLRLPLRNPRPILVSDEALPETIAVESNADDRVATGERERVARHACAEVDRLLQELDAEDRFILQLRFWHARKVPEISRQLGIAQKKLYKRLDKIFEVLRRNLEAAGVRRGDINTLLSRGDQDLRFDFLHGTGGNNGFGPSPHAGGERVDGGKGRVP
jgi:RNA polymerase sigma factor (sigma-70 family)